MARRMEGRVIPREPLTYALFFDSYNEFYPRLVAMPELDFLTLDERAHQFKQYCTTHRRPSEFGYLFGIGELHLSCDMFGVVHREWYEPTCYQVDVTEKYQPYVTHCTACSRCGGVLALEEFPAPNYCPKCGAKVVKE